MRWHSFVIVFVAAGLVAPPLVRAADDAEAHIKKGLELRKLGRDQAALPEFEQAYKTHKTPRSAAQLGLCEQALGRWTEASDHLTEALEAKSDPWVQKNFDVLESSLATVKSHVATIEVLGEPPGASVLVSGRDVGRIPLAGPIAVNAGTVDVLVRAEGYEDVLRSLVVTAGQYQRVFVTLEAKAKPLPPPSAAGENPSGETGASDSSVAAHSDDAPRPVYKRAWFWVAIGAVVAAGAATGILLATRKTEYATGVERPVP